MQVRGAMTRALERGDVGTGVALDRASRRAWVLFSEARLMTAALSITVDVDGAAGLPGGGAGYEHRLSSWSERTYGLTARARSASSACSTSSTLAATFYVPGITAERHPSEIAALAATRHEIGHHGHTHRRPDELGRTRRSGATSSRASARSRRVTGRSPQGYRAPGWELTTCTLGALGESGFAFDSSLMGDDRPYLIEAA